ncbi:hypothetical protein OG874_00405 [Nocardia sp. NBC_00565]|uniref:hypothetical protein n=1 Tax=Nocardia sp. NBC_00565 TaxID=2975993 RepID=UPI002E7FE11B|nr:hypothetical protein [Nocardia sp. NBC_00565]WUC03716.1 hypothetical protein OG874_00405 [Nocardia sp. NBC_00565]
MSEALTELEQRVTAKLYAALPQWELPPDPLQDPAEFWRRAVEEADVPPLPDDWPQFPREQWITYPARRAYALLLADNAIDHGYLSEAGFLVQYGGKERIS